VCEYQHVATKTNFIKMLLHKLTPLWKGVASNRHLGFFQTIICPRINNFGTSATLSNEELLSLTAKSRSIFGQLPFSNVRTGNKILRKKFIGPLVTQDHHKSFANELKTVFPEFMTDVEERRKAKLAYLRRRGKGPPKKGEGKRATKRGKKK
jgi:small subunit ribosomal protein S33